MAKEPISQTEPEITKVRSCKQAKHKDASNRNCSFCSSFSANFFYTAQQAFYYQYS